VRKHGKISPTIKETHREFKDVPRSRRQFKDIPRSNLRNS